MQWFNLTGQKFENDVPEEVEVFPLKHIPVECEDAPVHDGTWPCGDPDCPCALYGYGVPSLDDL